MSTFDRTYYREKYGPTWRDDAPDVPAFRVGGEWFALAESESALAQRWIDDDVNVSGEQCNACGSSGYELRKDANDHFVVVCVGDDFHEGCGTIYYAHPVKEYEAVCNW